MPSDDIEPGDRFGNLTALYVVAGGNDIFGRKWLLQCDCGTSEPRYERSLLTRPSVLRPRMCRFCKVQRNAAALDWLDREARRRKAEHWRMFEYAHGAAFDE